MDETEKAAHKLEMRQRAPWWAPDTQSIMQIFLSVSIVYIVWFIIHQLLTGEALKIDPSVRDLVVFIFGIIFGNFKDVFGFTFGSSAADKQKGEALNRSIESKDKIIAAGVESTAKVAAEAAIAARPEDGQPRVKTVVSWWSLLDEREKLAIEGASLQDDNIRAVVTKFKTGKAEPSDLATLVAKGLLKEERSRLLQTANTEVI